MRISDWSSDVCSSDLEFVGGLKGTVDVSGKNWSWDVSYQRGKSTYRRDLSNNINRVNIYNATDSVVVTAANQGDSDLPIGSVVCRTSLTLPSNGRSEEHTSELQSLMRISYAVFCLKKKKLKNKYRHT